MISVPEVWIDDMESALAHLVERERLSVSRLVVDATIEKARRAGWRPPARASKESAPARKRGAKAQLSEPV